MYKGRIRTRRTNPDYLNGVPELLLLSLLSRRAMYGYELVQAIRAATGGALEFGEGCIYPILHRLEAVGIRCASSTWSDRWFGVSAVRDNCSNSSFRWRSAVGSCAGSVIQGGCNGRCKPASRIIHVSCGGAA
jgi:PadR family transcriptional regulator, regulatory protein PadR